MEDQKWELLLTDRVSTEQFELLHELGRSQPERIASWMTAYMERVPEGSVLLDAAYSLLPAGDWPLVIDCSSIYDLINIFVKLLQIQDRDFPSAFDLNNTQPFKLAEFAADRFPCNPDIVGQFFA